MARHGGRKNLCLVDMYENYVELHFVGITQGREPEGVYVIVLQEPVGRRLYPVLTDEVGYNQVVAAIDRQDFTPTRLMVKFIKRLGFRIQGVRLLRPSNGRNMAMLDFRRGEEAVSISATVSEATLAALQSHCSFWVNRELFQVYVNIHPVPGAMTVPLHGMSNTLLRNALKAAVETENFELASMLRDELSQREADEK